LKSSIVPNTTNKEATPLNIIFAGTPHFAAHHLQALIDSQHNVVAVYTQPDRPSGRGKKLTPSPVKALALQHDLPVEQPLSLKVANAQTTLAAYNADVMVVVAYGLLLPQIVLDTPRYGCLNVHGSLLPRWRGAAPIQRAIEMGDSETGITIMQMDKGLDTGDMLLTVACDITATETSASLHDKLMMLGTPALLEVLSQLSSGTVVAEKQNNDLACYAEKITKQEAEIDWGEAAEHIVQKIQAFNPFPIAYSFLNDKRIKIYSASVTENSKAIASGTIISVDDDGIAIACGQQAILVSMLQIPNKKAMTVKELLNGYNDYFIAGQPFISSHVEKE
jgi:methionyl-tRNA formyltransferase